MRARWPPEERCATRSAIAGAPYRAERGPRLRPPPRCPAREYPRLTMRPQRPPETHRSLPPPRSRVATLQAATMSRPGAARPANSRAGFRTRFAHPDRGKRGVATVAGSDRVEARRPARRTAGRRGSARDPVREGQSEAGVRCEGAEVIVPGRRSRRHDRDLVWMGGAGGNQIASPAQTFDNLMVRIGARHRGWRGTVHLRCPHDPSREPGGFRAR